MADNDPFDMGSAAEQPDELEKRRREIALWCEKYSLVFGSPMGQEVLGHMKQRAFIDRPVMQGNAPQHVRDAREGMRMLMLETESFIKHHEKGTYRQDVQRTAISNTTEARDEA